MAGSPLFPYFVSLIFTFFFIHFSLQSLFKKTLHLYSLNASLNLTRTRKGKDFLCFLFVCLFETAFPSASGADVVEGAEVERVLAASK